MKKDTDFRSYKSAALPKLKASPDWPGSEHGQFVVLYSGFVKSVHNKTLPDFNWSIKPLRNLLAHPSGARGVTVLISTILDSTSSSPTLSHFNRGLWLQGSCAESLTNSTPPLSPVS
jgi:hypothetical protein